MTCNYLPGGNIEGERPYKTDSDVCVLKNKQIGGGGGGGGVDEGREGEEGDEGIGGAVGAGKVKGVGLWAKKVKDIVREEINAALAKYLKSAEAQWSRIEKCACDKKPKESKEPEKPKETKEPKEPKKPKETKEQRKPER